jgi:hypothetical protein
MHPALAARYTHAPDCPSLCPTQKEPDALTRLVRHIRRSRDGEAYTEEALSLISEVRGETSFQTQFHRTQLADRDLEISRLKEKVAHLLNGQQPASEARQRAFLEMAQEMTDMSPEQMARHVKRVLERYDGGGM